MAKYDKMAKYGKIWQNGILVHFFEECCCPVSVLFEILVVRNVFLLSGIPFSQCFLSVPAR